jgi:hypothetical protein
MKQADFKFLPDQVKQMYLRKLESHEKMLAEEAQKLQQMQAGFIPIGGAMIACEMYVSDPSDPKKAPKRVRVPYQALDWLIKSLERQGMTMQKLESMQKTAQVEVGGMMPQKQIAPMGQGSPMGQQQGRPMGAEMPGGVNNVGRTNAVGPSQSSAPVQPVQPAGGRGTIPRTGPSSV